MLTASFAGHLGLRGGVLVLRPSRGDSGTCPDERGVRGRDSGHGTFVRADQVRRVMECLERPVTTRTDRVLRGCCGLEPVDRRAPEVGARRALLVGEPVLQPAGLCGVAAVVRRRAEPEAVDERRAISLVTERRREESPRGGRAVLDPAVADSKKSVRVLAEVVGIDPRSLDAPPVGQLSRDVLDRAVVRRRDDDLEARQLRPQPAEADLPSSGAPARPGIRLERLVRRCQDGEPVSTVDDGRRDQLTQHRRLPCAGRPVDTEQAGAVTQAGTDLVDGQLLGRDQRVRRVGGPATFRHAIRCEQVHDRVEHRRVPDVEPCRSVGLVTEAGGKGRSDVPARRCTGDPVEVVGHEAVEEVRVGHLVDVAGVDRVRPHEHGIRRERGTHSPRVSDHRGQVAHESRTHRGSARGDRHRPRLHDLRLVVVPFLHPRRHEPSQCRGRVVEAVQPAGLVWSGIERASQRPRCL